MKVITTGRLNRFWTKGIKPWLDKRIKSYADLMVTTASGYTPDALAVKEGFTEVTGKFGKLLWKGSFTSGTIAVPGINKYICIAVNVGGVICVGNKNYGIGGYVKYGYYSIFTYGYRFIVNTNDTVVIDKYNFGGSDGTKNVEIMEIYGIF